MFFSICKATAKTLFRAKTFWLALAILLIFVCHEIISVTHQSYSYELGQVVDQGHPLFVFSYRTYIQKCIGVLQNLLHYPIPIFTVIITALILNRDYQDNFFELEKSRGIKARQYVFARLITASFICFVITIIFCFVYFHGQVIPMLDCDEMSTEEYFCDSTIRLLRHAFATVPPCVIFYVCATYCAGVLLKSGIGAAVIGFAYIIFCYLWDMFNVANTGVFLEYLRPSSPLKLIYYVYYYDTEWFEWMKETFHTSFDKAAICWFFLLGISTASALISAYLIRKRTV